MVGTLTVHRVANVETELWIEEVPRQGKRETRRIRCAERKSGVAITSPLRRRRWVVLASGNGVCASSPVLQTAGTGKKDLGVLAPVYHPLTCYSPCIFGFLEIQQPGQSEHRRGSISARPGAGTREHQEPLREAQQVGRVSDPLTAPEP